MTTSYKTDLSKLPVLMQGFQPCCVEAAVCAYMEYYFLMKTGIYTPLSFRYLATLTAQKDGINYVTGGTNLAVALQIAKDTGVCTEATYPSNITISPSEFVMPSLIPQAAHDEAASHKIPDFKILEDITWAGINAAIQEYKLVLIGLYLDKEWYLSNVPNVNPLPLPPPLGMTDPSISKHMTLSYGFDANYRYMRNSFGTTFGNAGDGYYTHAYQPYIFSGAVIIDPSVLQIATAQLSQVATDISKVDPASPQAPQEENLIEEVLEKVEEEIETVL